MRKGSITLDDGDLGAVNKPTFFGYKVGYGDGAMNVDYVYETLPAFRAYFNVVGGAHYGSVETIPFSGIDFNNGDHYNSATSEFTAPSNGYYSFGAQITAGTSSLGNGSVAFYLNDTRYRDIIQFEGSTAQHYEQHGVSFAYMSAGDTMKIKAIGSTNSTPVNINYDGSNSGGGTSFFGYKVGYGDGVSIKTFTKSGSVAFYNDGNVGIGTETPAAKLDVAGDINCTSLGASLANVVIDATYPVGTIIDRATAITDTHPNGKFKAFLGAPNQEWIQKQSPTTGHAFSAKFDIVETSQSFSSGDVVPFSNVTFGSSNFSNSEYTVPVTGQYLFNLTVAQGSWQYVGLSLMSKPVGTSTFIVKRKMFNRAYHPSFENEAINLRGNTLIVDCTEGEMIRLQLDSNAPIADDGQQYHYLAADSELIFEGSAIDVSYSDNYKYERTT
jgi:hypothetical protein